MKKIVVVFAALVVLAAFASSKVMSYQAPEPAAAEPAALDPAAPVEGTTIVGVGPQPFAQPVQAFPQFIANGQVFAGGMVTSYDPATMALQGAYQQLGQTIDADKQANQATSPAKLKLHKALRDYLAEEALDRIAEELEQIEAQYSGAPAARKAKLALKALAFDVKGAEVPAKGASTVPDYDPAEAE